jgi:hypothetical protein
VITLFAEGSFLVQHKSQANGKVPANKVITKKIRKKFSRGVWKMEPNKNAACYPENPGFNCFT